MPRPDIQPAGAEREGIWSVTLTERQRRDLNELDFAPLSNDPSENAVQLREAREALVTLGLSQFADIGVWKSTDPQQKGVLKSTIEWRPEYTRDVSPHWEGGYPAYNHRSNGVTLRFTERVVQRRAA